MLADRLVEAATYTSVANTEGLWRATCHAAYYAVFHALCDVGEVQLFKDPGAGRLARRAVSHDSVLKRANHYRSARPNDPSWNDTQWRVGRSPTVPSGDLVRVADAVISSDSCSYNHAMDAATNEVGVRELKNQLSRYLDQVKSGGEVTVT